MDFSDPLYGRAYFLCLSELLRLQREEGEEVCLAKAKPWQQMARREQLPPPGDWRVWLILAGRGFGKTRAGAETIKSWVSAREAKRLALVSCTLHEAREVMVEGVSGILSLYSASSAPRFESSKHRLTWKNGAVASLFGAADAMSKRTCARALLLGAHR